MKASTERRLGRWRSGHKERPTWWMGLAIVEVTSLQSKPGVQGGKLPGSLRTKRSRGRRGRRVGKARGRQPRDTRVAAPRPAKPTDTKPISSDKYRGPAGYISKVRARRVRYIESRFRAILGERKRGRTIPVPRFVSGQGEVWVRKKVWMLRLEAFDRAWTGPRPPSGSMLDWFRRWVDLKEGTWTSAFDELEEGYTSLSDWQDSLCPIPVGKRPLRLLSTRVCRSCGYVGPGDSHAFNQCKGKRKPGRPSGSRRKV